MSFQDDGSLERIRMRREGDSGLISNFPGIIYQCLNGERWTMKFVSEGSRELSGYEPHELINNSTISFVELIHSEDKDYVYKKVQRSVRERRSYGLEYRIRTRRSGLKWVSEKGHGVFSAEGELLALEGYIVDISDRKEAESRLRRYAEIVENIQIGLLVYTLEDQNDNHSLCLTEINPAAERLTGLQARQIVGKSIDEIFPDLREGGIPQLFAKVARTGKATIVEEFRYGDGREADSIWNFRAFPLPNRSVGVAFNDITQRKRLQEQFFQAQKMEVVGRMASGIAHDFNNVLTGIAGFAELAGAALPENSEIQQDLMQIPRLVDRASRLTRQLLDFTRKPEETTSVVDLNELIQDSSKMLSKLVSRDTEIDFHPLSDKLRVRADPGEIEQILMNLIVNAGDAISGPGRITIETDLRAIDARESIKLPIGPGEYVVLKVTDTGHGMDKETLTHIFEPFFTTKKAGEGTGLGLSVIYGIVANLGGQVWVRSRPGQGTVFEILLPRAKSDEVEDLQRVETFLPKGAETVLVIDDEVFIRHLVENVLSDLGYQVLAVSSPQEATFRLNQKGNSIDLLITDTVSSVAQPCWRLVEPHFRDGQVKVLYISGYSQKILQREVEQAEFLQKPFTAGVLARKVRDLLDQ